MVQSHSMTMMHVKRGDFQNFGYQGCLPSEKLFGENVGMHEFKNIMNISVESIEYH